MRRRAARMRWPARRRPLRYAGSSAQAASYWSLGSPPPLKSKTGNRVVIRLLPNAESKLRTHEQLKAVTEGKFAMATSFGGALAAESPVFLMSSLPFVTPTVRDQRALYEAVWPKPTLGAYGLVWPGPIRVSA